MPELGNIGGMAVDMGFDQQVNDLRYQQQMLRQQEAQNEAKRKLFESDMEFQKGGNAFDQPLVKAENQKIVQSIGDYISSNPDWETNFSKRGYVKQLKASLKDNPHVLRALSTNDNRQALLKYAQDAKQKGISFDEDALNNELQRYSNYEKFGNPDGEEALQSEGMKAYLFTRPQDFENLPSKWLGIGKGVADFNLVDTGQGGYYSKPKEEQMNALVNAAKQQNPRQIQVEAQKLGLDTPQKVDKWIRDGISAGVQKHFKVGDALGWWNASMNNQELQMKKQDAKAKAQASKSPDYTNWEYFTDQTSGGKDAKTNLAGVLDDKLFNEVWGGTQDVKAIGSDGAIADLSDQEFHHKGKYINKGGVTFIPGYVDMPLDVAEAKGIYKQGKLTWDGIKSNFKNSAKEVVITNKDGSTQDAIRVEYDLPINRRDNVARQKFNIATNVSKQVAPSSGEPRTGRKVRNNKTGQEGILYDDGTIESL